MRRRRSLDELLPLTLFSSLGTNGLNSSAQMGRGRGSEGQHGGGWWGQELQAAPRDRRMEADSHIHGQNSTHVHLLAPDFWRPAAHCALPGGLEGSVASGGYESSRCDPETVALFPDHMLGNANDSCIYARYLRS